MRRDEDLLGGTQLHLLASVGHADAVAEIAGQPDVVGDEEHRDAGILLEVLEEIHDLRLDADVEGGSRLVENEHIRVERQRGGDADALALSAAELVWVATGEIGRKPNPLQQFAHAGASGGLVESSFEQKGLCYLL